MHDITLDHLVFATPDLERTVAEVTALTGVRPAEGGSHPGRGTRNYLLGLSGPGAGGYFEIVGPDPGQPAPTRPRWFGIDSLTGPRLVHWAVRTTDIDALVARARSRGYDPGEPVALSRRTPQGTTLSWRLTHPQPHGRGGLVPFLLDWGETQHPTAHGLPSLPLVSLTLAHPEPESVRTDLAAVGVVIGVDAGASVAAGPCVERAGRASLTAVLAGAHGPVTFSDGVSVP